MTVTVGSTITVENPSQELIQWCSQNLKISNPEYAKKLRMHFWLGNTPKELCLYEIHGDNLILPFGVLRDILPYVSSAKVFRAFTGRAKVNYECSVPLYDYQQTAVEVLREQRYGILQSPAGSGKTQMGIALMADLGLKTLWLTHTKDLLTQSKERAELYMSSDLIGTITEGKVNIGSGVTFATVQTMCRLDLEKYRDVWDVVIVDECHRCSGTPTAMTQFYKVLNNLAARYKYGLSATVHRSDGTIKATYALLGKVVYTVPEEAVAERVMKVGIKPCFTEIRLSRECLNTDGTLNYAKLITYLTGNTARNQFIADSIERKPSLILSDRLSHLEKLMNLLPVDMQEDAVMISGKMNSGKGKIERKQALEDMRSGKKKYLFATYSLCKEGLDIPRLERLYMTTPIKDYAVVTQSIGRIARTFEGKEAPICYDFVDDAGYLVKAYKKRCSIYRKNGCYFVEEVQDE